MDRLKLSGVFDHTVDPKGRVTLPARYRDYFADGATVVRLPEREPCLSVFHADSWDDFDARHLEPLDPFGSSEDDWTQRDIYQSMFEVEVDKQGRILLPQQLAKELNLSGAVKILGVKTHLEIWNPDTLAARQAERREKHA